MLYGISVHLFAPATIHSPGFDREQQVKPEVTKKIEGVDEGNSPDYVAKQMIKGAFSLPRRVLARDSYRCSLTRTALQASNEATSPSRTSWLGTPCAIAGASRRATTSTSSSSMRSSVLCVASCAGVPTCDCDAPPGRALTFILNPALASKLIFPIWRWLSADGEVKKMAKQLQQKQ